MNQRELSIEYCDDWQDLTALNGEGEVGAMLEV